MVGAEAGRLCKGLAAPGSKMVLCGLVLLRDDDGGRLCSRRPEVWSADDLCSGIGYIYECICSLLTAVGRTRLGVAVAGSDLEGQQWRRGAGRAEGVYVSVGVPKAVEDGLAGRRIQKIDRRPAGALTQCLPGVVDGPLYQHGFRP